MSNLHEIISSIWTFSEGLNKTHFNWNNLPKQVKVLAGTDTSGLVRFKKRDYYVHYEWTTNAIVIEPK